MPKFSSLTEWLDWVIELTSGERSRGFEVCSQLANQLNLQKLPMPVITVAGTNGKGSTVAALESIYTAAGYRVGAFTSPHVFEFNERIRVNQTNVSDDVLREAFEQLDQSVDSQQLNFFSFVFFASLIIFQHQSCDVVILEVGIGGRLDVTNTVENDIAVITSIGFDHCEILGDTIEKIAAEKAAIMRANKPAVFGYYQLPESVQQKARELTANLQVASRDYFYLGLPDRWMFCCGNKTYENLPLPIIYLPNAAAALMTVEMMQQKLPVPFEVIQEGLNQIKIKGRCEVVAEDVTKIFDVAHNQQSVELLAKKVSELKAKKVYAVFSTLKSKDVDAIVMPMKSIVDRWFVSEMQDAATASLERIQQALQGRVVEPFSSIHDAYLQAQATAQSGDVVVVFGSFRIFNEL